ncbi:hypothetical protein SCHPADRAFT_948427, partial [Schizopora paradoxa]
MSIKWSSVKVNFRDKDYVFDKPKWRMEDSDVILEPDVTLDFQFFAPKVVAVGSDGSHSRIVWEKEPVLKIPIPTTRHDVMVDLAAVASSAEESHKGNAYRLRLEDRLRVFSQQQWANIDPEQQRELFAIANILVKHDKSAAVHPVPIFPDIKKWCRSQIALHFDLFASRFMQDQTWASDFVRSRVGQHLQPIPRYKLIDNGKASAFHAKIGGNKLLGPTFAPKTFDNNAGCSSEPKERDDVTLADLRNNPDLRLRCASLDMLFKNLDRHEELRRSGD